MSRPMTQMPSMADGFMTDCENLIHRCTQADILNYTTFCNIWKDMNFDCIFHGRTSGAELAELSEEVLYVGKMYMLSKTEKFEESVAGIFLMYALLNVQPFPGFARLRLVPEDVKMLQMIETKARRYRRLDVLLALGWILVKGSHCHADARERALEPPIRKYLDGTVIDRNCTRPKGVLNRQNEELDILRELNFLGRKYAEAKSCISNDRKPDKSLSYSNNNIAVELDTSLNKLINGLIETDISKQESTECRYDSIQSIKTRAMATGVNQIKHLIGVEERQKRKSELTSDKNKTGSSTKPLATESPVRRNPTRSVSVHKESFISPKKEEEQKKGIKRKRPQNKSKKKKVDTVSPDGDEINLNNFDMPKPSTPSTSEPQPESFNIEIGTLPVLIRSENQGQYIEIEIIDKYKEVDSENQTNTSSEIDIFNKIKQLTDVSIKKVEDDIEDTENSESININNIEKPNNVTEMAKISKVKDSLIMSDRITLNKMDKSEMKKTILKSKFKRLGMLPVANFDEKQNED